MGQGCRRRGPALASAGQRPVRRASLRLRRSRPAALGPHARRRGWGTAAAWHVRAPCSGRPRSTARRPRGSGTTAARYALAHRSGRPRSKARQLWGSGEHRSPARAGAPLWPAEVDGAPAAGVGGPSLPGTRGRPAQARRGRRRAGLGGRGLPQPGTRGCPRSGPPRSRASTRLKREGR